MSRKPKTARAAPDMSLAADLATPVAGVDEAGRGPWAGPLVAAAAILADHHAIEGLDDSKRLTLRRREALAEALEQAASDGHAAIGIAVIEAEEIDRLGLGRANDEAMRRAIAALDQSSLGAPATVLVDGRRVPPGMRSPARAIVGGDGLVSAIAAASILAKVTRDRLMETLDARHPGYGWATNRGYGTAEHRSALERLGPTPQHRHCFRPVAEVCMGLRGGGQRQHIVV
ncbi:MAG: ribonuclease HII [Pseudomonadota bacterium]